MDQSRRQRNIISCPCTNKREVNITMPRPMHTPVSQSGPPDPYHRYDYAAGVPPYEPYNRLPLHPPRHQTHPPPHERPMMESYRRPYYRMHEEEYPYPPSPYGPLSYPLRDMPYNHEYYPKRSVPPYPPPVRGPDCTPISSNLTDMDVDHQIDSYEGQAPEILHNTSNPKTSDEACKHRNSEETCKKKVKDAKKPPRPYSELLAALSVRTRKFASKYISLFSFNSQQIFPVIQQLNITYSFNWKESVFWRS